MKKKMFSLSLLAAKFIYANKMFPGYTLSKCFASLIHVVSLTLYIQFLTNT